MKTKHDTAIEPIARPDAKPPGGGSYIVQVDGSLARVACTQPAKSYAAPEPADRPQAEEPAAAADPVSPNA